MKKNISSKIFSYILIVLIIISLAFVLCGFLSSDFTKKDFIDYSYDWYNVSNELVDLKKINDDYVIHKQLDEENIKDSLVLVTKSINTKIFIDDVEVYKTELPNKIMGKTAGTEIIMISLNESYKNKTLTIELTSPYHDKRGGITEIYYGNGKDILNSFLANKYFGACLCLAYVIIGVVLIILYFSFKRKKIISSAILYLGLFGFNIGVFTFCDSKVLQVIYGKEFLIHTLSEIWMYLIILPMILFTNKIFNKKSKFITNLYAIYSIILFVVTFILNYLNIYDYHETIFLVHISYLMYIPYIIYMCLLNRKTIKNYKMHLIAILAVIINVVLDLIIFKFNVATGTSMFTRVGVFLFLIIEVINVINQRLSDYQLEMKLEILNKLAYYDGLTNLLNRTSFIEDMDKFKENNRNVIIAVFDVNNLKTTNDTLGHMVGDKLIREASYSINTYPGSIGKAYRIGGDEFVVIIDDKTKEDELKKLLVEMNNYLEKKSIEEDLLISVASGYSVYSKRKHNSLTDTFNEADDKMYKCKEKMKKNVAKKQ